MESDERQRGAAGRQKCFRRCSAAAGDDLAADVIWKIRLPRLLAGMVLGGALALSGYLLQVFFTTPLPALLLLGISSGAKLTVALALIFVLRQHRMASAAFLILAAFAGGYAVHGALCCLWRAGFGV